MTGLDLVAHVRSLVGTTILTLTGRPNQVLRVKGRTVIVGTERSPAGKPVPLDDLEAAYRQLSRDGVIEVRPRTVGYRSAFVGAVLLTIPGVEQADEPQTLRL